MSLESTIKDALKALQPSCAVNNYALITNLGSPARVAQALSGQRPFDNEDGLLYMNVLRKLKALQDAAYPIPIDWSETEAIKAILAGISAGTLHISVHQETPVIPAEQQFYVFMPGEGFYFCRRTLDFNKKVKIVGSYQPIAAPRMTKECADKIIELLRKSGHQGQTVVARATEDCPQDDFKVLWGHDEVECPMTNE
jgi:hypothetical protein